MIQQFPDTQQLLLPSYLPEKEDDDATQCCSNHNNDNKNPLLSYFFQIVWVVYLIIGCVFLFEGDLSKLSSGGECSGVWGVYLSRIILEVIYIFMIFLFNMGYISTLNFSECWWWGTASTFSSKQVEEKETAEMWCEIWNLLLYFVLATVQTAVYAAGLQQVSDPFCKDAVTHNCFTHETFLEVWVWIFAVIDWISFASVLFTLIKMTFSSK